MTTKTNIRLIADDNGWFTRHDEPENDMVSVDDFLSESDVRPSDALALTCERFGVDASHIEKNF